MAIRRLHRIALTIAAAAVVAAAGTGIGYAVTKTTAVTACANSHHTLKLLKANGRCPSRFHKITLGQQGPKGTTGKTGNTGARGPGATGLVIDAESATAQKDSADIGHTGLTVRAICDPTLGGSTAVYLMNGTTNGSYFVHGQYDALIGGTGAAYQVAGGNATTLPGGAGLVYYEQDGTSNSHSGIVLQNGQLAADIIVARGTETFTVHLYLNQAVGRCQVHAQVTPTS